MNKYWVFAFIIIVLILFWPALFVFFVQDDFWLLAISKAQNVSEAFHFLIPRYDTVWYRPLSSQIFFFIGRWAFGLRPLFFHLIVFVTHLITVWLVFRFTKSLTKQKSVSLLSAFIYATHQIHVLSLSWLAAYSFVLGPLFLVLTLYLWEEGRGKSAAAAFIFGLLTSEVLVLVPALLVIRHWVQGKKLSFKDALFFVFPVLLFGIARYILFPTQLQTSLYAVEISMRTLTSTLFYLYRLVGIPLGIDQMPLYAACFTTLISATLIGLLGWGAKLVWTNRKQRKLLIQLSLQAFICFIPFIVLPDHLSPHYLAYALIVAAPLFAILLWTVFQHKQMKFASLLLLFLVLYFMSQYSGSRWVMSSHWLFSRARLAQSLISEKRFAHPVGSEEYFALGANSAEETFASLTR